MNSDSPLNWEKIANPTIPVSNINNKYSSYSYNTLILLIINFLLVFVCLFIYQNNKKYINNKQPNDDQDYNKWN